jgi:valyl-tRNA synthetase
MTATSEVSLQDLPSQYDHAGAQERWYPFWERCGYFHADPNDPSPPYTIVIPPPNVTGALHLGHALNNTLQDILVRMKRMQGYNVLWMPGTDHAGIATQAVVERRLLEEEGQSRHDLGREGLVKRIWNWKEQYEARILGQLKQLGCSCDWKRTRFTLDDTCARAVRETFFQLFQDDKIYRGKRLVNWDTFLQTAVSDDEVFHETVKGHFWHINYPVIDPKRGEPTHVTIATTRPETMLGDTAVAVHPDPAAALEKVKLSLVEKLASAPEKDQPFLKEQITALEVHRKTKLAGLEQLRDMARDGRKLLLPLVEREIPIIADPWAKPELGSGSVKITPAHDPNDYDVWKRNQEIGAINIINPDGTLNENAGPYVGLKIKKAREKVVADLESQGLLPEIEDREIDLAHSDRSKTPIEPYLADQWFVKMDQLAQSAMDAVTDGRVTIVPKRYAKGYLDWLGEKRDWPIGRQLWWGHRIPVWTLNQEKLPDHPAAASNATTQLHRMLDGLADFKKADRLSIKQEEENGKITKVFVCVRSENDPEVINCLEKDNWFRQEDDVLDTWFSSALWPHSTLGWPENTGELAKFYPTSTLVTSRDIITLWVARMVLTGLYNMNGIPFKEVYVHPKILDGYGETMSKSKGNGVDPVDVIEKFGADALRFGIAYLTTETQDVRMPVDFECPHCQALVKQTKKNRRLPRIECQKCNEPFRTQWAESEEDQTLQRGSVVSDRFELGRNFCNKLWNASRFSLMNLSKYEAGPVDSENLRLEDRWLLSRLTTVTQQVTSALHEYRYADAARTLYDFAWDEFCSFYVEMTKTRFAVAAERTTAQRVLAHALDTILRLLHPLIPFLTEEVWQRLNEVAPTRGLPKPVAAAESVCVAPWPDTNASYQDPAIEEQFAQFQAVLGAVRKIRTENNLPTREPVDFHVRCNPSVAKLLEPMQPYFSSMAKATAKALGPDTTSPQRSASEALAGLEVHLDMSAFFDVDVERARLGKQLEDLAGRIESINKKLTNENFVNKAPANVVAQQRESLAEAQAQLDSIKIAIEKLAGD